MSNVISSSYWLSVFPLLFLLVGCIPPGLEEEEAIDTREVRIDLQDPITRKLADFQDRRQTDSLLRYFASQNASYRYYAARAFGSYTDPAAHPPLLELLDDPVDLVRSAAAHALGQQEVPGTELGEQLVAAFRLDSTNRQRTSHTQLLQAIGKRAGEKRLDQLAAVQSYGPRDTNLLSGLAWAIYYYGRRKIVTPTADQRALSLADAGRPREVRYPALAHLARYAAAPDSNARPALVDQLGRETDPELRAWLALAVGKDPGVPARRALLNRLGREPDWRVRVNLLSGLANHPYGTIKDALLNRLEDPHELVARRAADLLLERGTPEDATLYWNLGRDSFPPLIRYKLYEAANRHLPYYFADYRSSINYQLQQAFEQSDDPYERAAILDAMAAFPWNYRIITDLGFNHPDAAVRTAAVRGLATISKRTDFEAFFRASTRRVRAELSEAFRRAIESGDVGMIYEASQPLGDPSTPYRDAYPDLSWARESLDALPLPEAVESHRALEVAIANLTGDEVPATVPPAHNRAIDWESLDAAGDAPLVRLHTARGKIDVALWPELAPGTVSNFLRLAAADFFNGLPFHRVVPNFVAQGGDPRGDGYGSVDFTIRTETPAQHWDQAGLIGMASAGRDTESIQFFLTHSGVPHLDGRYTAFGRVTAGQEIVDALRVGDVIERVEIR